MKPELRITVVKLTPRRLGSEAEVCVRIDAVSGGEILNSEFRNVVVASDMLFELGNIGEGTLPYELSQEAFETLEYGGEMWEVVKKGLDILAYGDNTKRQLEIKLRSRGFGELSAGAAEYLAKRGYIDEESLLRRYVESLAGTKKYGPARIKQEVSRKGFSREIIDGNLYDILDECDFDENLSAIVERKFDFSRSDDRKYRESFIASIYRLGYSPSDTAKIIREKS